MLGGTFGLVGTDCRVWHGYLDTYGYLLLGGIADTGYLGYLSITHTQVCVILTQGQYPRILVSMYRGYSRKGLSNVSDPICMKMNSVELMSTFSGL